MADHREKLSDGKPFFGQVTFSERFPGVESVLVTVQDSEFGSTEKPQITRYSEESVGEFHDCTATYCYKGGIRIGNLLREMVRERKEDGSFARDCCGKLGSPKGRNTYGKCNHFFEVTAKIVYKPAKV